MDKYYSLFGKFVLILIAGGLLLGAGYYLGKNIAKPVTKQQAFITPTDIPTQVPTAAVSPTQVPKATGRFAVAAGGIKPFVAYTLSGVAGWSQNHETTTASDKVTLTKGGYQIVILQAALGGGACSFPGTTPAPMSITLTSATDIPLLSGYALRRGQTQSTSGNQSSFAVCQKASDGSYGTITDFGVINYTTPLTPDNSVLAEMDAMVGSLQKK
ncbi:MAG: hypothetical protein KGJ07_06265 [Patescibacteria group bacterium]|nr:hypothetical protein [Patescibacteria group bacterium]MDE2588284.1 hypothetical protein [Patescibacteria group bacterium]